MGMGIHTAQTGLIAHMRAEREGPRRGVINRAAFLINSGEFGHGYVCDLLAFVASFAPKMVGGKN